MEKRLDDDKAESYWIIEWNDEKRRVGRDLLVSFFNSLRFFVHLNFCNKNSFKFWKTVEIKKNST